MTYAYLWTVTADATAVVSIANKFKDCDIDGKFGRYIIDLKSILGVLSFELPKTIEVVIQSDNTKLIEDLEHQLGFWKVEDDDRIIWEVCSNYRWGCSIL